MTPRDEMLNIRSAYHEPLALLKVNTLKLHMQVLGRLRYADGDIELMRGL
jgi:hypothetical protein